jgi:hypothetical protein
MKYGVTFLIYTPIIKTHTGRYTHNNSATEGGHAKDLQNCLQQWIAAGRNV